MTRPSFSSPINPARRLFLGQAGLSVGSLALASLWSSSVQASTTSPLAARPSHYPPKAKAVIHLFMAGAPSHLELFDYKPKLAEYEGKPIPPR